MLNAQSIEDLPLHNRYNEVWEIGLMVLSRAGDCAFFRHLNRVLEMMDYQAMETILRFYHSLTPEQKRSLTEGAGPASRLFEAVRHLEGAMEDTGE